MTDTLDKLKKAFQQAISTATGVQPWNEPLTRRDSVQSGQAQSAPIVQGGLGAWVGSSGFPYTGTTDLGIQTGVVTPARNSFQLGLGLPGVPDVDFVPYAANTNRFGGKGPSLIGHPISWEVVGPTLKSPYCDWQWAVNLGANTLTLEAGPYPMPGSATPLPGDAYGINAISDFEALGGLYVMFSFTGEGFTGSLAGGRTPILPNFKGKAPFELFRIALMSGQTFTLHAEKPLVNYFGSGNGCRAVTLVRPKVARMAAFPAPITGQVQANRTFVFMPPETSANSEYMPPLKSGAVTGTWITGGFDVAGTIPAASGAHFGTSVKLPIPRPLAQVDAVIPVGGPYGADEWHISVPVLNTIFTVGRIVRVTNLVDDASTTLASGDPSSAYGYFEITNVVAGPPTNLTLRRVVEANPDTGAVFYGNGPIATGSPVPVTLEVYDNISSFFLDPNFNINNLASARLTNLIDPRTSGPSISYRDTSGPALVPPSSPDRAIFNTKSGEDPGNLLDLGFRTVFFPGKQLTVGGDVVPDFSRPIDGNNLVLDPSINEPQFIEVDYSAGVAYLSHTPQPGSDVFPTTLDPFFAPNNPRHEVVLFAAFVPYSMEDGQTGGGVRVSASSTLSELSGFGDSDYADVFGRRIITQPLTAQTLNPVGSAQLVTTLPLVTEIPPAGFFFLVQNSGGVITTRLGPYAYQYATLPGAGVQLNGITGPGGAVALDPATGWKIVLQRSFREYAPLTVSADTVRGSSKRISSLQFKHTDVSFGADGSVIIHPLGGDLDDAYHAGRVINSDVGPIEVRPAGSSTLPGDAEAGFQSQFLSRYDLGSDPTSKKVGYDFIGRRSVIPFTGQDNFAGYMDRRVFAPQAGYTVLGNVSSYQFDISASGTDEIVVTTGGNQFHDGGSTNRTYLMNDLDLIQIIGLGLYVFHAQVNGSPTHYTVRNLDGTTPVIPASLYKGCTAFRPRFFTGFGFAPILATQGGTWITSEGPPPTLRLFAGSAIVQDGPDAGGSTESLEFWYRSAEKTPVSANSFDTFGRLTSVNLTPPVSDQLFRGPFLTRVVRSPSLGGAAFGMGHLIETTNIGVGAPSRSYDYSSLVSNGMGTAGTATFNFTASATDTLHIAAGAGFTHRKVDLSGGTLVEVLSYNAVPVSDVRGLYRLVGCSNPGAVANQGDFQLIRLDGSAPVFVAPTTGTCRFYSASYVGFGADDYYNYLGILSSHRPSIVAGVQNIDTSVGLHISAPDPTSVANAAAIRVTSNTISIGAPFSGKAFEVFRVDLLGGVITLGDISAPTGNISAGVNVSASANVVGGNFLYTTPAVRTKKISAQGFQAEGITSDLVAVPSAPWYYPGIGAGITSKNSPTRSNQLAKLDLSQFLSNGDVLSSITVRVKPGAVRPTAGDRMLFVLYKGDGTSTAPTSLANTTDNGTTTEQNVSVTPGSPETLDFTTHTYWLVVLASNGSVPADDSIYSATLNYSSAGPS